MTDRPIKPGDLVERTGESALGLVKGERYVVLDLDEHPTDRSRPPFLVFYESVGSFNPRGFRLVEGE